MSKFPRLDSTEDVATRRREQAEASVHAGVNDIRPDAYAKKWTQFRMFCMDEFLLEGNITIYLEAEGQPEGTL